MEDSHGNFQKLFRKSNHPLLDPFLRHQPSGTQKKLREVFDKLRMKFELITWTSIDKASNQDIGKKAGHYNICNWINNDHKTGCAYGLGRIDFDLFTEIMDWINDITVSGQSSVVRVVGQDSKERRIVQKK